MHTRKEYLIYPPNYAPGMRYLTRKSKRQAWVAALKFGDGASVSVGLHRYAAKRSRWIGYSLRSMYSVERIYG